MGGYVVGIDLGTSNTVVAAAARDGSGAPEIVPIPQRASATTTEALALFPSTAFAYTTGELTPDASLGEADGWTLGAFARRRATEVPGRAVSSAKSWLCHDAVDRLAPILPWGGDEACPKLSPVEVATRLLARVRDAWDATHPDARLAAQDVVLTVPASFDEVARELTIAAASAAGLTPRLLEEPQAAFYEAMRRGAVAELEAGLAPGESARVLVCDVGGGTTDLSLLELARTGPGPVEVRRVAVGAHLLLGGDNMDLALAHALEPRLVAPPDRLDPRRFAELTLACRHAKERLFAREAPDEIRVSVLGRGSSLLGNVMTATLAREEAERIVLDGFLPLVDAAARPARARGGLVAFGLPYERDVAITRHLAAFLARHLPAGARLDAVLLNGGVFHAPRLVARTLEALTRLTGHAPRELAEADPDRAVALGAVAFGLALGGQGRRIGGGAARGYFLGLGTDPAGLTRAISVVPKGAEEGRTFRIDSQPLKLLVGAPARFPLFTADAGSVPAGEVVTIDEERFEALPTLTTSLGDARGRAKELGVGLSAELTPVGTLDLACVELAPPPGAEARRFRLAFDLRAAATEGADAQPALSRRPARAIDDALAAVGAVFDRESAAGDREAKALPRELTRLLGEREEWSADAARALCDRLLASAKGRRRSAEHERVYFSLLGFCLRPGVGAPGDEKRVSRLGALFAEKLAYPLETRGWQQLFVCFRRVVTGLPEHTQEAMRDQLDGFVAPREAQRKKPKGWAPLSEADLLDLLASLERVPAARRVELGEWILERTWTSRDPRWWAALGRLGARVPAYASLHHVIAPSVAERWLDQLLRDKWAELPTAARAASELARQTGDRARDVSPRVRDEVARRLEKEGADARLLRVVHEIVPIDDVDRVAFLGERLPVGLRLG